MNEKCEFYIELPRNLYNSMLKKGQTLKELYLFPEDIDIDHSHNRFYWLEVDVSRRQEVVGWLDAMGIPWQEEKEFIGKDERENS